MKPKSPADRIAHPLTWLCIAALLLVAKARAEPLQALGRIAFVDGRPQQVYAINSDGSGRIQLTTNPGPESYGSPEWSPDGQYIAFDHHADGSNIYRMNADGTDPVRLTDLSAVAVGPAEAVDATWSPGGNRIAFTTVYSPGSMTLGIRPGMPDLWVMDADGDNPINLTNDGLSFYYTPAWSPDGTRIAFGWRDDHTPTQIHLIDPTGANRTVLDTEPSMRDAFFPAWSPDGTRIAFASTRDGNSEIYVMDADGSNPVRLTEHPATDTSPTWSPDGTRIAFVSNRDEESGVYIMNQDGTNVRFLTPGWSPAWGPATTAPTAVLHRGWALIKKSPRRSDR